MKTQKKLAYEMKTANKTKTSTKQECSQKILRLIGRVTSSTPAFLDCTPTILSVLLCMKKEGYSQATLRFVSKALKFLSDHSIKEDNILRNG